MTASLNNLLRESGSTFTKQLYVTSLENYANNKTVAASLENLLSESRSTFTKLFHVTCIAHVLNLAVQGGLKELGNSSLTSLCLKSEGDEEYENDDIKGGASHKRV